MTIRHSLKTLIRSWKRTLLFILMAALLMLVLGNSLHMTAVISQFLKQCNNDYTTIGVLEYTGSNYPDETAADPQLQAMLEDFDPASIAHEPYVLQWEKNSSTFGYTGPLSHENEESPYFHYMVQIIHVNSVEDPGVPEEDALFQNVQATVLSTLYSSQDDTGKIIYFTILGHAFEEGHNYIVHSYSNSRYARSIAASVLPFKNSQTYDDLPMVTEIPDLGTNAIEAALTLPEYSQYAAMAQTYEILNSGLKIIQTGNLEALLPFHQNSVQIVSGRSFSEDEYSQKAPVCVISEKLAAMLNLNVGDTLPLSVAAAQGDTLYETYDHEKGFDTSMDFTIIGLTGGEEDQPHTVYIPPNAHPAFSGSTFSYTLGQVVIENRHADAFYNQVTQKLPPKVRLTMYDQGYAAVAAPYINMLHTALLTSGICLLCGLILIILFGFLFVYRQRQTARTMYYIGAGKGKIFLYFLTGAGTTAGIGTLAGLGITLALSGQMMELIKTLAQSYTTQQSHFSNSYLSTTKTISFEPRLQTALLVITGIAIIAAILISCLCFTAASLAAPRKNLQMMAARTHVKSCTLKGGAFKYALLAFTRGKLRSIIPGFLCAGCLIFIFQLTDSTADYEKQIQDIYANTTIRGYFTDISAKRQDQLVIPPANAAKLYNHELFSQVNMTSTMNYQYIGPIRQSGQETGFSPDTPEAGSFAAETLKENIALGNDLIFTNNIEASPEFYYQTNLSLDFLEGYDQTLFSQRELANPQMPNTADAVVSADFLLQNGLSMGDEIAIYWLSTMGAPFEVHLKIIGSFSAEKSSGSIYVPMDYFISLKDLAENSLPVSGEWAASHSLNSLNFELADCMHLDKARDWLADAGYSEKNLVRSIRNFIVIEDQQFLSTQNILEQKLWYTKYLYPIIYVITWVVALVISWIMVQIRRREAAIMRGLGTPKMTAFAGIFTEQVLIIVSGVILALAAGLVTHTLQPEGLTLAAVFVILWLAGSTISAVCINRQQIGAWRGRED